MRIRELHLPAYGAFTDVVFDFGEKQAAGDLQIFYGNNESGKSTLIQSLSDLFYGFQQTSRAPWVHDSKKLRVGARIQWAGLNGSPEEQLFFRKVGRKNTILNESQAPISEEFLEEALAGRDRDYFEKNLQVIHSNIVSGGAFLLQSDGKLGESLLSASMGNADSLRKIRSTISEKIDKIYTSRGRKQLIHQALQDYKNSKPTLYTSRNLDKDFREEERLKKELHLLEEQLREIVRKQRNLENVRKLRPSLRSWAELKESLGSESLLAATALKEAADIVSSLNEATRIKKDREISCSELQEALDALPKNFHKPSFEKSTLDDVSKLIHQWEVLRDKYDEENSSIISLEKDIKQLQERLSQTFLRSAKPAELEVDSDELERLLFLSEEEAKSFDKWREGENSNRQKIAELEKKLSSNDEENRAASTEVELSQQLRLLLDQLSEQKGQWRALNQLKEDSQKEKKLLLNDRELLLKLGVLFADNQSESELLEAMARFSVPERSQVQRLADGLAKAKRELKEAEDRRDTLLSTKERLAGTFSELREQAVPSVAELLECRDERDRVIEELSLGKNELKQAMFQVKSADTMADAWRNNAELVAKRKSAEDELRDVEQKLKEEQRCLEKLGHASAGFKADWENIQKPSGMNCDEPDIWLSYEERARHIIEKSRICLSQLEDISVKERELSKYCADIQIELRSTSWWKEESMASIFADEHGKAFELLDSLKVRVKEQDELKLRSQGAAAARELERKEQNIQLEELRSQTRRWSTLKNIAVAQVLWRGADEFGRDSLVEAIHGLRRKDEALKICQKNSSDCLRKSAQFFAEISRLYLDSSENQAKELESSSDYFEYLENARIWQQESLSYYEIQTQREGKESEFKGMRSKFEMSDAELKKIEGRLSRWKEQHALELTNEDVSSWIDHQNLRCSQALRMKEIETELNDAFALTLAQAQKCCSEAEGLHIDESVQELEAESLRLTQNRDEVLKNITQVRMSIKDEGGGRSAAKDLQEQQYHESRIRKLFEEYLRLTAMDYAIDAQARQLEEQGTHEIIDVASEYFRQMSLGEYVRLDVQTDANDQKNLVAVRDQGGVEVSLSSLSDGARDQLFLALRLSTLSCAASKESSASTEEGSTVPLHRVERLPLICDDILVQFDDERARASLALLRDFSQNQQVILTTHHAHIQRLAAELGDGLHCHQVG